MGIHPVRSRSDRGGSTCEGAYVYVHHRDHRSQHEGHEDQHHSSNVLAEVPQSNGPKHQDSF
ncbi:hypothetical protein C8T65DRAFT_658258 [Cerioporus squamosus]|nr:hypothetical protein C8T65DRAFT_658258 [Cerioporus squamosus]